MSHKKQKKAQPVFTSKLSMRFHKEDFIDPEDPKTVRIDLGLVGALECLCDDVKRLDVLLK